MLIGSITRPVSGQTAEFANVEKCQTDINHSVQLLTDKIRKVKLTLSMA